MINMVDKSNKKFGLRIKNKIICSRIVLCDNMLRQGSGLMFRSENSVKDTAWIFYFKRPRRISLTMLFVFFPIDAIFLDSNKKIVEITSLQPWSFYNPKIKTNYCIELEYGAVQMKKLKIGDKLVF